MASDAMGGGWTFVPLIYLSSLLLHVLLPARTVSGYCCDNTTFQPLQYRLNGVFVLAVVIVGFVVLLPSSVQQALYNDNSSALASANAFGLAASFYFFFRKAAPERYARCVTIDQLKDKSQLRLALPTPSSPVVFFLGREWNPRFGSVDVKMFLYVVGAVMLQCNIISAAIVQRAAWNGQTSNAMAVYLGCFTWFIVEYMCGEQVHLYTYDLFAEKLGFKLAWGCLVFYPFFYPIGSHALAKATRDISPSVAISIAALYFAGWLITRGANLQKYFYRTNPSSSTCFFGLIPQQVVPGTRILCSGFWGLARHFNYLGEIVQAIALALPGTLVADTGLEAALPWLYPIYYVGLFVTRQMDDDAVCKLKYGDKWDEYCARVPYRIVPWIY
ncbi:hypothetical protein Ae201684P_013159 [Aphanomyces euteiches]|uniref:Steroid 5-alpha reductase C-terminal domain-containing protein n=1 Tax=Aphanomyces euteiches TaxID=100861 RepID=A0A6G0WS90_9STRA|nr:hypothetical protein Ae201684_012344 [Aphanomyces euteiches]KAH9096491.1 hypothetical protein Ae201684P_013159 [Aphanomyces euteiches]KAH9157243.1 hypothetical protein AeRB84_000918 [Aphanomyces euteiches]